MSIPQRKKTKTGGLDGDQEPILEKEGTINSLRRIYAAALSEYHDLRLIHVGLVVGDVRDKVGDVPRLRSIMGELLY